jgi:hypothetical protein
LQRLYKQYYDATEKNLSSYCTPWSWKKTVLQQTKDIQKPIMDTILNETEAEKDKQHQKQLA